MEYLEINEEALAKLKELGVTDENIRTGQSAAEYHHMGLFLGRKAGVSSFMCGMKLNALKLSTPHGSFMKAVEIIAPLISHSTATRFMRLYSEAILHIKIKLPEHGELSLAQEKAVLEALGKTKTRHLLTDSLAEIGITREKQHQKHTPPRELSAEDRLAAEKEMLVSNLRSIRHDCLIIRDRGIAENALLSPEEWNDLLNDMLPVCKLARELRRNRR